MIEWGIAHWGSPDWLHRGPFTFGEAIDWLVGWEQDGGSPREFLLVRREVGDWTPASEDLKNPEEPGRIGRLDV